MSQSALEHIESDFDAIKKITKVLIKNKEPFIQIHMVPSASGCGYICGMVGDNTQEQIFPY